ncbi:hypothetical protein [Subtercola frigoramans]|uniref:LPXTG cell wall anchor domain-containing protein n=1 Tax=Subtercola frigoramans TaxID=120298 RepID=A0ABS2L5U9_9MICO|nr:hypothetical protein [Subtercola frigoramans]MBM7472442.1 hypothetical protein [Subtercola frigoramans]
MPVKPRFVVRAGALIGTAVMAVMLAVWPSAAHAVGAANAVDAATCTTVPTPAFMQQPWLAFSEGPNPYSGEAGIFLEQQLQNLNTTILELSGGVNSTLLEEASSQLVLVTQGRDVLANMIHLDTEISTTELTQADPSDSTGWSESLATLTQAFDADPSSTAVDDYIAVIQPFLQAGLDGSNPIWTMALVDSGSEAEQSIQTRADRYQTIVQGGAEQLSVSQQSCETGLGTTPPVTGTPTTGVPTSTSIPLATDPKQADSMSSSPLTTSAQQTRLADTGLDGTTVFASGGIMLLAGILVLWRVRRTTGA